MARSQRYKWLRDAASGIIQKIDTATDREIEIDLNQFDPTIKAEMFVYGGTKIIDDRLSQVDTDDKMDAVETIIVQFRDGKWKADKVVGARMLPPVIEIIMRVKGWKVSKAQKSWAAQDDQTKAAILENYKDEIEEIKDERKDAEEGSLDDMAS